MDAIFGMEFPLLVKFVISFAIVLAADRRGRLSGAAIRRERRSPASAQRGRQPRLGRRRYAPVDSRRSLVIVRRDNVEHLLLIGGPTDVLVEPNISQCGHAVHAATRNSAARPSAAAVLPAPNWAPETPAGRRRVRLTRQPRIEPAQKVEPRLERTIRTAVRSEPAFLAGAVPTIGDRRAHPAGSGI